MSGFMNLRIVLVEPEYEQNIGYCARIMKNFGFSDLWIVNPKVRIREEAIKYSKHAVDVLRNAKLTKSLDHATKGCELIVGTTAIKGTGRTILRNAIAPHELKLPKNSAILFGREGTGLTPKELELCDIVVRIPANESYPTLNISHALAVILYELCKKNAEQDLLHESIGANEKHMIQKLFDLIVDSSKGIRSPSTVKLAFRRIIARGIKSPIEGRALLQILKNVVYNNYRKRQTEK
jgi:tRNA/rRNA methyltransferase